MNRLKSSALRVAATLVVFASAGLQAQPASGSVTVSGNAAHRQRTAMPPVAVHAVRVEDVSRADAAAMLLAETREPFGARQVPIASSLQAPSASIDPRLRYVVRAIVVVAGEMRFTTTRNHPVLTRGAPVTVDLMLAAQASRPRHRSGSAGVSRVIAPRSTWRLSTRARVHHRRTRPVATCRPPPARPARRRCPPGQRPAAHR